MLPGLDITSSFPPGLGAGGQVGEGRGGGGGGGGGGAWSTIRKYFRRI